MVKILKVEIDDKKSEICDRTLRGLPDWFGIESSIIDYVKAVRKMPFFAAAEGAAAIGFAAIKEHNAYTAEVYVMGILQEYHRLGIGARLVECCEDFCRQNGIEFLTVKTLDELHPDKGYAGTRRFYIAQGFRPLEVFPLLWGEENPCLLMAKYIKKA